MIWNISSSDGLENTLLQCYGRCFCCFVRFWDEDSKNMIIWCNLTKHLLEVNRIKQDHVLVSIVFYPTLTDLAFLFAISPPTGTKLPITQRYTHRQQICIHTPTSSFRAYLLESSTLVPWQYIKIPPLLLSLMINCI